MLSTLYITNKNGLYVFPQYNMNFRGATYTADELTSGVYDLGLYSPIIILYKKGIQINHLVRIAAGIAHDFPQIEPNWLETFRYIIKDRILQEQTRQYNEENGLIPTYETDYSWMERDMIVSRRIKEGKLIEKELDQIIPLLIRYTLI